jgi:V/A-type H+-transporting ATPase subunit A
MPLERQLESFQLIKDLIQRNYQFKDKEEAHNIFTQMTSLYKNLNYSPTESQEYQRYRKEIEDLAATYSIGDSDGSNSSA